MPPDLAHDALLVNDFPRSLFELIREKVERVSHILLPEQIQVFERLFFWGRIRDDHIPKVIHLVNMGLVEVSSAIEVDRFSNLTLTTQESFVVL